MRLDDNLEIRAVVANRVDVAGGCMHGDIYDSVDAMRADYPNSAPMFGAIVADRNTGHVAEGYDDWYPDVQSAYEAWLANGLRPFKLTVEYDGRDGVAIRYHDGTDDELYHAAARPDIIRIVREAVETALSPEAD